MRVCGASEDLERFVLKKRKVYSSCKERGRRPRRRPESVALSRTGKNGFSENGFNLYDGDPTGSRTRV